jgi:hypothetical protein
MTYGGVDACVHVSLASIRLAASGRIQAPVALPQAKIPPHRFQRRLGRFQSRFERSGEEKGVTLPGLELEFFYTVHITFLSA